jgi:DNA primase
MTIYSTFNVGVVAPQSETVVIDSKTIDNFYNNSKIIVTLFDNDIAGETLTKKYWDKYKIPGIELPKNSSCKDISDYYKKYGKEETTKLLYSIL